MSISLTEAQARRLRLHAQGLTEDRRTGTSVQSAVHDCCGLQAQNATVAPLSIRARASGSTAADVTAALVAERSIVRTWCMRGTLHYIPADDLPSALSLFGPRYVERGRRRLSDLGLDDTDCELALSLVRDTLAESGPLTRHELADRLLEAGLEFDPDGQAPVHIVRRACLEGAAIQAGRRDGTETYALLDNWIDVGDAPSREDALTCLARRYVAAHEPATLDDFYSWSGLYMEDVHTGWSAIEPELTEVDIEGERSWIVSSPEIDRDSSPTVRLLPMYDSYFLGHGDRHLVLPDEYADRIYPGGGVIRAALVVDGLATGTWSLEQSRNPPVVTVEPFVDVDATVETGIEREVAEISDFLERDVRLELST